MEQVTRIFVDTSKQFFQLHGVNAQDRVVVRKKLRRAQFEAFIAQQEATVFGLEACGSAHHWARRLLAHGHEAKLIAPQHIRPYVPRNKNDARDAQGGCEAMSRPHMRFVPVKSAEQQAGLMLSSLRAQLVRQRTRLGNMIRGYAAEFGQVIARGLHQLGTLLERLAQEPGLPAQAGALFRLLGRQYEALEADVAEVDAQLRHWQRANPTCRRLIAIPGVGPIGAALLVLKTPQPHAFRSGRDFAAWLGLTPRDHSTAGRQRLGVITRAGDEMLRSVLVAGATAVIQQAQRNHTAPPSWLSRLLQRKPPKLAAVALANKTARIAWKLMASGDDYQPGHVPPPPHRLPAPATA